jgi:hypothetical protein
LYLTSNKINEGIDIIIMISKNDLNLFFCVYVHKSDSEVHWDFNSQSESPLGSLWAHSLTLSHTSGNVNVISELHSWPALLHAPCFSREPKVRVVTLTFAQ